MTLPKLIFRVLARRSVGTLNIATGETHSFRDIAERVVAAAPRQVAIKSSPRNGPMPHNGYRPFDIAACRSGIPRFQLTPDRRGDRQAQRDMAGALMAEVDLLRALPRTKRNIQKTEGGQGSGGRRDL